MKYQTYGQSPRKILGMVERRRKIIACIQDNPSMTQGQLGAMFGVNRCTISRDFKAITDDLKIQNMEGWIVQRERILREIQVNKDKCMARLERLSKDAAKGSRWMEEWTKLLKEEIRILGIQSPEKLLLNKTKEFSKVEEDAAIDAAMLDMDDSVIDITPRLIADKG
jgi:hypothetical protein